MNKRVFLLSVLLLPVFAVAAPFCVFEPRSGTTNCWYYDMQSCRQAAGTSGACVVNPNEVRPNGGFSQTPPINQRPPLKYIDRNPVTDTIERNTQEMAKQRAEEREIEQRQLEIDRQNIETPQQNTPVPTVDPNAPLTLVCIVRAGAESAELTHVVDMANQTVNGWPARISDNSIEWEAIDKTTLFDSKIYFSVNRLTGWLMVRRFGDVVQGACKVVSQANRKF